MLLIYVACILGASIGAANLIALCLWWPEVRLTAIKEFHGGFLGAEELLGIREFSTDALNIARSLGRLDLISVWLVILGVLLTIMALIGYKSIQGEAREIARETAQKAAIEILGKKEKLKKSKGRKSSPGQGSRDSLSDNQEPAKQKLQNKGAN